MNSNMVKIKDLVAQRQELKIQLRYIEEDLTKEIFALPDNVLEAIAHDIVKPNFPVPYRVRCELKALVLNEK